MRTKRRLVAVAVLSIALQPCLPCVPEQDGPAVRSAEPCHDATHQVATACPGVLAADTEVAPTVRAAALAPLPAAPQVALVPLRSVCEATIEPTAPADGPPLWLRHASLLV